MRVGRLKNRETKVGIELMNTWTTKSVASVTKRKDNFRIKPRLTGARVIGNHPSRMAWQSDTSAMSFLFSHIQMCKKHNKIKLFRKRILELVLLTEQFWNPNKKFERAHNDKNGWLKKFGNYISTFRKFPWWLKAQIRNQSHKEERFREWILTSELIHIKFTVVWDKHIF